MTLLSEIQWVKKNPVVDQLLSHEDQLRDVPLGAGLEADVVKVCLDESSVALKIWNKGRSLDVGYQFSILQSLREQGVSVSEPLGWGYDGDSNQVLATSYDGKPVDRVDSEKLNQLAGILAQIHRFPVKAGLSLRTYDFIPYFFYEISETPDLLQVLKPLCEEVGVRQDHLIHGDFNLGNILENNGMFTVIDWTNVQLGDARYDLAWASFLIRIYVNESAYEDFLNSYLAINPYIKEDLDVFEAIACLRWLHLYRIAEDLPMEDHTVDLVNNFIKSSKHLPEELRIE